MRAIGLGTFLAIALAGCSGSPAPMTDGGTTPGQDGGGPTGNLAWPQIPGMASGTLRNFKMVTIVAMGDPDIDQLFAFSNAVPASQWWRDSAADYNLGTITRNVNVTGAAITGTRINGAQLEQYIRDSIAGNADAANDGNTLFMVYLPPGVSEGDTGTAECATLGYHTIANDGLVWGFAQRCPPTAAWISQFDALVSTGAHEIIEAATNRDVATGFQIQQATPPWTGSVWTSPGQGEVGDLCDSSYWLEGGFLYQRSWSNSAAMRGGDPCVPAITAPYYQVTAPEQWYPVMPGQTVMIPLTVHGPATGPWSLAVNLNPPAEAPMGTMGALTVTTTLDGTDGTAGIMVSPGNTPMLAVTADMAATSTQYHILQLRSTVPTSTRDSQDEYHTWFVGVYVP
jgi:hypothetical protein